MKNDQFSRRKPDDFETIKTSKTIGSTLESYQKARNPEGEDGQSKKGDGSDQKN